MVSVDALPSSDFSILLVYVSIVRFHGNNVLSEKKKIYFSNFVILI